MPPGGMLNRISILNCRLIGTSILNEPAIIANNANDIFITNNSIDIETQQNAGIRIYNSLRPIVSHNKIYIHGSTTSALGAIGLQSTTYSLIEFNNINLKSDIGYNPLSGIILGRSLNASVRYNNVTTITSYARTLDIGLAISGDYLMTSRSVHSYGNRFEGT